MDDHEHEADPDADQRPARHGLISTSELAAHYNLTPGAARKLMSSNGISEVRGYPREAALGIHRPGRHPAPGPGRGHRECPDDPEQPGGSA